MFKKNPGVYCEDCKYYIPSESASKHPYFSKCARLIMTRQAPAPRVARNVPDLEYNQDCVDARKSAGDCGKQGKYWEENKQ
jgi:hypothetical protein